MTIALPTASAKYTAPDPEALRRAAAYDLDVFAGIVMPQIAIFRFPVFYRELWVLCIRSFLDLSPDNKLFKLLLILPRGHAKTTFIKLLIAYGIIHGLFNFIVVVCASDNNAENFVEDVVFMLTHENVRQLYGDWAAGLSEDNATEKVSYFMGRRVIFHAASILASSLRGISKDLERPDFIVCDDVQTKEVAESEKLSDKLADTLIGTVFKIKSPRRCGIVYMGNMYPRNCIADRLANSGEFITLRTGAILANGDALWPELHSLTSLRAEWRLDCSLGKGHIWMAEVQNQPLERDGLQPLFPDGDFPITIMDDGTTIVGSFVTIDPAGRKRTSDDTAIAGHLVYEGTDTFELASLSATIRNPRQTILDALAIAEKIKASLIFVEAVAYQETLAFWGEEVLRELGLSEAYKFLPLSVGSQSKLSRIRAWVGELLAGQYIIADKEVKQEILYQGLLFNPSRTDNTDDKLDVAAAGTLVRNKFLSVVLDAYENFTAPKRTATELVTVRANLSARLHSLYHN